MDPNTILTHTAHRPWPVPSTPWFMVQQWSDLLFAHWAFDPEIIRPLIPKELELDLYDGKAWIGVTPFRMTDIHLRGLPPIPGAGRFLEMNLRTYVRIPQGPIGEAQEHAAPGNDPKDKVVKPGIFFFSLDASNLPAVVGARIGFGLPYFWSDMHTVQIGEEWHYTSSRKQTPAEIEVRYAPIGDVLTNKNELEIFLTERYCLYEVRLGVVLQTEIHHVEWPLQKAKAEFVRNTLGAAHNIPLTLQPDLLHYSKELDVLVFPPTGKLV